MPQLLNTATVMMCPHGGTVNVVSTNTKAKAGGDFILRSSDTFTITGCPLTIGNTPHPCVRVQWAKSALKPKAVGEFVLNTDSVGLCIAADQAQQGTVLITTTQAKVLGT